MFVIYKSSAYVMGNVLVQWFERYLPFLQIKGLAPNNAKF